MAEQERLAARPSHPPEMKRAARSCNRAAPTLTNYYETQAGALLSRAGLKQSNQNCKDETALRVILFKHS